MSGDDGTLLVIAQVALGLIGFGAIVVALQSRSLSEWSIIERAGFWALINGGLFGAFEGRTGLYGHQNRFMRRKQGLDHNRNDRQRDEEQHRQLRGQEEPEEGAIFHEPDRCLS